MLSVLEADTVTTLAAPALLSATQIGGQTSPSKPQASRKDKAC
jgi:hypothetical protein